MLKNGFVKKNVGTFTLGERLNKIRTEKRITLGEVSRVTRIQVKYLEYLEGGFYDKLPADVYIKGFIRSYSQYLGADENHFIKLYERERDIHKNIKKEETKKGLARPIKFSSLVITPKVLLGIVIVFFIGLGFFYLYRELSIFISNPRLVITDPEENFITEEKIIKVEGITEKDAKLFINDQPTVVNEEGRFSESLVIQPGLNKIAIKAINRFEKESEKIITGEGKFSFNSENISPENQVPEEQKEEVETKKIKLEVWGETKPVAISVKADDEVIFNGSINPGTTKNFEAENRIFISAEKGKYLRIVLNGKDLGTLSKDTKSASRTFNAE